MITTYSKPNFRRSRHYADYDFNDIDSSPESYRNVSIPQSCLLLNEEPNKYYDIDNERQSPTLTNLKYNCDGKRTVNFYLRRREPNSIIKDNDWIIVQNDCLL